MQPPDHPLYGKGSSGPKREEGCISGAWTRAFTYAACVSFFCFCRSFLFYFQERGWAGLLFIYSQCPTKRSRGPPICDLLIIFCGSFCAPTGTGSRNNKKIYNKKRIQLIFPYAKSRYIPQVGCCCESYELWAMFTNKVSRVFAALLTLCTTTRNWWNVIRLRSRTFSLFGGLFPEKRIRRGIYSAFNINRDRGSRRISPAYISRGIRSVYLPRSDNAYEDVRIFESVKSSSRDVNIRNVRMRGCEKKIKKWE